MSSKSITRLAMRNYDFQNEARFNSQCKDLMVCALALDHPFEKFAV